MHCPAWWPSTACGTARKPHGGLVCHMTAPIRLNHHQKTKHTGHFVVGVDYANESRSLPSFLPPFPFPPSPQSGRGPPSPGLQVVGWLEQLGGMESLRQSQPPQPWPLKDSWSS
jgi:hypothetical protein